VPDDGRRHFHFLGGALLQFFISYCRSLIACLLEQALSAEVKDVTGHPEDRFWG